MRAIRKAALKVIRFSVLSYLVLYCLVTFRIKNLFMLLTNIRNSKSQIFQDLMIIATVSNPDRLNNFYFVEFGATDGISISNSYLFESVFGAKGILAEPAKIWHDSLKANRRCAISYECVWEKSHEVLEFIETSNPDLSGLSQQQDSSRKIAGSTNYNVDTISLNDLLHEHLAPNRIGLLSIDTEGSEYRILSTLNFDEYKFEVIVCEHNYGVNRESIRRLLESNGYTRRHRMISYFDDWYFLNSPNPE